MSSRNLICKRARQRSLLPLIMQGWLQKTSDPSECFVSKLSLCSLTMIISELAYVFRIDYEVSLRRVVEADVARLRKSVDDSNVFCLNLETDIEFLKEDLIFLKKNHENVSSITQTLELNKMR